MAYLKTKSNIDRFVASMSKAKGFARPSQYEVKIDLPPVLHSVQTQYGQQITLHCNSVSMPGHDLQSQKVQYGSEPAYDMVTSHAYADTINASFYLSEDLKERHFFEQWQRLAVNIESHKANFYDDYIGSMEIYQLSNGLDSGLPFPSFIDKIFDVDMAEYGIRASEVYPATISGIEYSYESGNQIATMAVGFNYREWRNLGNTESKLRPYS